MNCIMQEALLRWELNGETQIPVLSSPGEEQALLTGLLLTGMAVGGPAAIGGIFRSGETWQVSAAEAVPFPTLERRLQMLPLRKAPPPPPRETVDLLAGSLGHSGDGLHTALLFAGGRLFRGRDIGRHNALDKAVGSAVLAGVDPEGAVLCTAGRLSLEMMAKAAAVGINAVCAAKQVGSMALAYAEKWGIRVLWPGDPGPKE